MSQKLGSDFSRGFLSFFFGQISDFNVFYPIKVFLLVLHFRFV